MNSNLNIIICSSSKHLSKLILNLLKQKKYDSLIVAKNRTQLFDFCEEYEIHIVIIDIDNKNFKLNSSENTIKDLIAKYKDLMILAIGDDISNEFASTVINYGAKEYLCKPFQPANLWERINRMSNIYISNHNTKNISTIKSNKMSDTDYLNLPKFALNLDNSLSRNIDCFIDNNSLQENLYTQTNFESNLKEKKMNKNILKKIFLKIFKNKK